jgi:hypothetical protein
LGAVAGEALQRALEKAKGGTKASNDGGDAAEELRVAMAEVKRAMQGEDDGEAASALQAFVQLCKDAE